jgi:hypothetical protein
MNIVASGPGTTVKGKGKAKSNKDKRIHLMS